jgi:hypothetical protein
MRNRLIGAAAVCAALAILAAAPAARAGDVKGQVLWAGDPPAAEKLKVDKDQGECLAHGPLLSEKYVVDPKSKGVRWVVVWLAVDAANPMKGPTPPAALKTPKEKKVTIDQPTCQFQPHVLAMREGQTLVVKNSAKVPHNTNIVGGAQNPNRNQIIPPGGSMDVTGFKSSKTAVSVSCTIHGWMKSWIRVFNHPYFAVTDAEGNYEIKDIPAGKYTLMVWQEEKGYLPDQKGTPVTVEAAGATNAGKIEIK